MIIKASLHSEVEISEREANNIARLVVCKILKVPASYEEVYIDKDGYLKAEYGRSPRETIKVFRAATELDKSIISVLKEIPQW